MALSRVKSWSAGEILYALDLNNEFENILDNALTLISPLTSSLNAGGFKITSYGTTDAVSATTDVAQNSYTADGTGVDARTLEEKLREGVSIEDFYVSTDSGKINNAFTRALAAGHKRILLTSQEEYSADNPITINQDSVTIESDREWTANINLTGTGLYVFDIGNASSVKSNIRLRNVSFTRSSVQAGSKCVRLRNVAYWVVSGCRAYMDSKFDTFLDFYSTYDGLIQRCLTNDPVLSHVTGSGGTNSGGTVDGVSVQNFIFDHEASGGNAAAGTPANVGSFFFDDNVQATWLQNVLNYGHKGYMAYFKGTLANRANNTLNLVINPNVEASASAGIVRFDNYISNFVGSSAGWSSGNGIPAVRFGANSVSNTVRAMQIGLSSCDGVLDEGTGNKVESVDFVGYSSGGAGVTYDGAAASGVVKDITCSQMTNCVVNSVDSSPGSANLVVDGVTYDNISSTAISAFNDAGTNKVRRIIKKDSAPFASSGATTTLPEGVDEHRIHLSAGGVTTVNSFTAGRWLGERIKIHIADATITLNDTTIAGGNIQLATAGSTVTGSARRVLCFEWDGSTWLEFARNG